jgi:hypothetical protein
MAIFITRSRTSTEAGTGPSLTLSEITLTKPRMAKRQHAELSNDKPIRPDGALIISYRNQTVITGSEPRGSRIKSNTNPD